MCERVDSDLRASSTRSFRQVWEEEDEADSIPDAPYAIAESI